MAYKKNSDNTFITDCAKNISDVTVTKAPFKITKQHGIKFISDISAGGIISVETDVTPGYENDITYRWYEKAYHPIDGRMENDLDVYTDYASCTFGSKEPRMEYAIARDFICVNNYDKDAVFAVAEYRDCKLLTIETTKLTANSGPFISKRPFHRIEDGADCLKAFLRSGLDTMNPLTLPIAATRRIVCVSTGKTRFSADSEEQPCTVIIASYDGKKLIDSKSVWLDESNKYSINTDYKSFGLNVENSTEIKAFVWKDFQTMKPIF